MPSTEIAMAISIPATGLVSKMSDVTRTEKSFSAQEKQYLKNHTSIIQTRTIITIAMCIKLCFVQHISGADIERKISGALEKIKLRTLERPVKFC